MSSSIHIHTIEALPNIKEYHLVEEITAGYSGDKKYKLEKDGKCICSEWEISPH